MCRYSTTGRGLRVLQDTDSEGFDTPQEAILAFLEKEEKVFVLEETELESEFWKETT